MCQCSGALHSVLTPAEVIDASGYSRDWRCRRDRRQRPVAASSTALQDVGSRLSRGAMFAPSYAENQAQVLPAYHRPFVSAMASDEVCAFINIDYEAVGSTGRAPGLPYGGYADLAARPRCWELVADCMDRCRTPTWPAKPGMADTPGGALLKCCNGNWTRPTTS